MIDLLASTETNDLVITNGVVQTVSGTAQISQAIRLVLLTFQGEWFLDQDYGVPWYTRVLGQKFSAGQIQLTVADSILSVRGVSSIIEISAVKNGIRSVLVTAKVQTTSGPLTVVAAVP